MDTVVYIIKNREVMSKSNTFIIKDSSNDETKNILSVSGERKAESLSKNKELSNIDAVYSSNQVSALSTAKYIAMENNTIINIDERLNERRIGDLGPMEYKEYIRLQNKDLDFKLVDGESLNETKKRMVDAFKQILMNECENRVAVISHNKSIGMIMSAWCEVGFNFDDQMILTYNDHTIIDSNVDDNVIFKVTFDGMTVKNIEYIEI